MQNEIKFSRRLVAGTTTAGVLLIVLGLFALIYFFQATVAATLVLGGLLIASGVVHWIDAFSTGKLGNLSSTSWSESCM